MNKKYKITLSNGITLDNLRKEGNSYVSSEIIDESKFYGNYSPVTISDGETEEIHENVELLYTQKIKNLNYVESEPEYEYWFALEDLYSIGLADGTVFENLRLNGNNFVSKKLIDASVFESNCSPVKIRTNGREEIHDNMELVQVIEQFPGEWYFILRDISKEELYKIKVQSDIEYLAMMSNVEL